MFSYEAYFPGSPALPLKVHWLHVAGNCEPELHTDEHGALSCQISWPPSQMAFNKREVTYNTLTDALRTCSRYMEGQITQAEAFLAIGAKYGYSYRDSAIQLPPDGRNAIGGSIDVSHEIHLLIHACLLFFCWCRIKWGDDSVPLSKYREFRGLFDGIDRELSDSEFAVQALRLGYGYSASLYFDWNRDNPEVHITGDTFAEALCIFMAQIVTATGAIINGNSVSQCSNCTASFIKTHGNATLCGNCNSNAEKLRAFRRRKKEGAMV